MRATVLLAGALANKPGNGGAAWTRLSWALGFRELGFDVHFVEQVDECDAAAAAWFSEITERFGLPATLLTRAAPDASTVPDADLLVNISGHLTRTDVRARARMSVFVDLDPGYTQVWHERGLAPLAPHDHWYTVGSSIGTPGCSIPTGGLPWRPIRQPVVLADWPVQPVGDPGRFTTVAAWRGPYGPFEFDGAVLGPKAHEFRRFLGLPAAAPGTFELALDIGEADAKDRSSLEEHGWRLADPAAVAGTPEAFRSYVQESGAEFSVAQAAYVRTACGWFGDRTVRYLASGRPALVQDTGLSTGLPTGEGLFAFRTIDDAVRGAEAIVEDYERHCAAAQALASEYFAAEVVLGRLCEEVDVAP